MNAEYPDLPYRPPAAYGRGRPLGPPRVIVIHYTAGAERSTSAEDGAAYDAKRTDGVSTHYFHDRDSTVQCVHTTDRANAAYWHGNRIGIQHELCGTVQTRAQWLDPASDATLTNAARQVARDCHRWNIPAVQLTAAQVRAGQRGICGHADITRAYPEDGGDHTDPGPAFPWDVFLDRVRRFHTPPVETAVPPTPPEDDMPTLITEQLPTDFAFDHNGARLPAGPLAMLLLPSLDNQVNALPWGSGYLTLGVDAYGDQAPPALRYRVAVYAVGAWTVQTVDVAYGGDARGWAPAGSALPNGTTKVVIGRVQVVAGEVVGDVVGAACVEIGRR